MCVRLMCVYVRMALPLCYMGLFIPIFICLPVFSLFISPPLSLSVPLPAIFGPCPPASSFASDRSSEPELGPANFLSVCDVCDNLVRKIRSCSRRQGF